MELPAVVRWIRYPKREDLAHGYSGFALLSCELDPYSKLYKPEMEEMAEQAISEKYQTFTVSLSTMLYDENDSPQGKAHVFIGDFVKDPKWGWQFKADFYYQDIPSTEETLRPFLMKLPNIKEERSLAIINKFGVEGTINILDNEPYRLTEISGINEKRVPPIIKVWENKKGLRNIYHWFFSKKMTVGLADKAFKLWGKDTIKVLQENPYRLVEIYGVGFIAADQEAHKITDSIPDEFRTKACMHFTLNETMRNGNLCLPYSVLKEQILYTIKKCDENLNKKTDLNIYLSLIPTVLRNNLDFFTAVKDMGNGTDGTYIYLKHVWDKERYIAQSIYSRKTFDKGLRECSDFEIENAEKNASEFNGRSIVLDEAQKLAIKSAFEHKLTVITGPGGSGKSMICRCIYYLAQKKGLTVRMVSPTGKAAQVLTSKTGCDAATIHRSLKMRPGDEIPRESIKEDLLLVDEISMCGLDTMYAIMQALSTNIWGNVIFVGDKNQLPSVSPGNFLSDIMESGCSNIVTLDKIHRQDEQSFIPILANDISKGKIVQIPPNAKDIKWHNVSILNFHDNIIDYIDSFLKQGHEISELQIISPMKKGDFGVFRLNELIQKKMSVVNETQDKKIISKYCNFHVGDRIIQIENNYDKMVFNGDIGVITDLGDKVMNQSVSDKNERFITVDFYGEKITYLEDEFVQLQLAWAITVHKFQGSQSPYILFVMVNEHKIMISKELVYTAFTRAEKQLDIFGHENMLRIAPTKSIIKKRYTNLTKSIQELKGNKKIFNVLTTAKKG